MFTTSGPSNANPIANAALSVSVNTPFAASSRERVDDLRDHRRLRRGEEDRHRRDERVEQQDQEVRPDEV